MLHPHCTWTGGSTSCQPHSGRQEGSFFMLPWEVGHCPAFNTSDPQALECLPWNCLCPTLVAVTSKGWQGSLSLDLLPLGSQVLEMHTLKFSTSPCSAWDGWGQNWQSYLGGVLWGHLWDECWFQSLFPFVRVLADHQVYGVNQMPWGPCTYGFVLNPAARPRFQERGLESGLFQLTTMVLVLWALGHQSSMKMLIWGDSYSC